MQHLLTAGKFLTLWSHLQTEQPGPEAIGRSAVYFPLIGLLVGFFLALLNYGLGSYVDSEILSIVLVAVLFAVTGGVHLDGVKKTFDALLPELSRPRSSNENISGVIAVLFVVLFKVTAIDVLGDKIALGLLLAPALARWALVLFIYGYQDRFDDLARRVAVQVKFAHLLASTSVILALAVYLLGRRGLWIGFSLSILVLLAPSWLYRRHEVLTFDNFGAVLELSETLSLILLASL